MSDGIDISTPEKLDACLAWLIESAVIPCAKGRVDLYEAIRRELDLAGRGRERERLAPFAAAMDEDSGALIVALYDLPKDELLRVIDAAQAVDAEGQDAFEALEAATSS